MLEEVDIETIPPYALTPHHYKMYPLFMGVNSKRSETRWTQKQGVLWITVADILKLEQILSSPSLQTLKSFLKTNLYKKPQP